jgi:hypothetical protein
MDILELIATLIQSLVWPVAILVILWLFEEEIAALFGRLRRAKFQGWGEIELAEQSIKGDLQEYREAAKAAELDEQVLSSVVSNLDVSYCRYLLKVANRELTSDSHFDVLSKEVKLLGEEYGLSKSSRDMQAVGYWWANILNFGGLLFALEGEEEGKILLKMEPEVLDLLSQRVRAEIPDVTSQHPTSPR